MTTLTAIQVSAFITEESNSNNSVISATIGSGGSGLDIRVWGEESIEELNAYVFDGIVEPCEDIANSDNFTADCPVYQFSNGELKLQVVTF